MRARNTIPLAIAVFVMSIGLRLSSSQSTQEPLRVAAASDLQEAFAILSRNFQSETGKRVEAIFGSSGMLARQAEQGAPFDAIFSANESFVSRLEAKGVAVPKSRDLYAVGRIAIWTREGPRSPLSLAELKDKRYRRIAIANPEHAPYGAAAKEAMIRAGVWEAVKGRIVYGDNVQQTLQYARSGNADAAIVALSIAIGSEGRYVPVSEKLHAPIRQAACVLRQAKDAEAARQFIVYVRSPKGQKVMRRFGFTLPVSGR